MAEKALVQNLRPKQAEEAENVEPTMENEKNISANDEVRLK